MKKSIKKLSLRKTTVTNLHREDQMMAKGGAIIVGDPILIIPTRFCSNYFTCLSHLATECLTRVGGACQSNKATCANYQSCFQVCNPL